MPTKQPSACHVHRSVEQLQALEIQRHVNPPSPHQSQCDSPWKASRPQMVCNTRVLRDVCTDDGFRQLLPPVQTRGVARRLCLCGVPASPFAHRTQTLARVVLGSCFRESRGAEDG